MNMTLGMITETPTQLTFTLPRDRTASPARDLFAIHCDKPRCGCRRGPESGWSPCPARDWYLEDRRVAVAA